VAHPDIPFKHEHVSLMKDITYQAIALANVQALLTPGDNSCRILTTVLHHGQRVIETLIDRPITYNTDDTTHFIA